MSQTNKGRAALAAVARWPIHLRHVASHSKCSVFEMVDIAGLVTRGAVAAVAVAVVVLVVTSALERNTAFVRSHPAAFALELLLMGAFVAVPVLLMACTRQASGPAGKRYALAAALVAAKMMALHALLELSGFYKRAIGPAGA